MFERDTGARAAAAGGAIPIRGGDRLLKPPPAAPAPAADPTSVHVAKLTNARIRADHDPLAARLVELTGAGLSLAEAIDQIEGKRHERST